MRRGASICRGTRIFLGLQDQFFFHWFKGGARFFMGSKGGTRIFFFLRLLEQFSYLCGGYVHFDTEGGPNFFHFVRGGTNFFLMFVRPRGSHSFYHSQREDQKKLAMARHK